MYIATFLCISLKFCGCLSYFLLTPLSDGSSNKLHNNSLSTDCLKKETLINFYNAIFFPVQRVRTEKSGLKLGTYIEVLSPRFISLTSIKTHEVSCVQILIALQYRFALYFHCSAKFFNPTTATCSTFPVSYPVYSMHRTTLNPLIQNSSFSGSAQKQVP